MLISSTSTRNNPEGEKKEFFFENNLPKIWLLAENVLI
jgi:hypothetical protein